MRSIAFKRMTDCAVDGINATLPAGRGGQAPKPRSGAPKAQGLRATPSRKTMRNAVRHKPISHFHLTRRPFGHLIWPRISTTLTDVTTKIGEAVDRAQEVIGWHMLLEAEAVEQSLLHHRPLAHHRSVPALSAHTDEVGR